MEIEISVNIVEMTKEILGAIQRTVDPNVGSEFRKGVIKYFEEEGELELLIEDLKKYIK